MKWFSHESSAHSSPKMQKLMARWGMAGLGLYWFIVECIAERWEEYGSSLHPSYDIELLAGIVRIESGQCQDMIRWMIDRGLFEAVDGQCLLCCSSLDDHLGEYAKKSNRRKNPKPNSGESPDNIRIVSGQCPPIRQDKTRQDKRINNTPPTAPQGGRSARADAGLYTAEFDNWWAHYPRKEAKKEAAKAFKTLAPNDALLARIIEDTKRRAETEAWTKESRKFCPLPATYLRGERWNDELPAAGAPAAKDEPDWFRGAI